MNEARSIRIGDREREEAVAWLGAHYEAGRLSAEEHQERVGEALQARTQADLAAQFVDLPGESKPEEKVREVPPWERAGRVPLPLLIALVVSGAIASVACVALGGHPPVLPLLLVVAGVVIAGKRRQGWQA